MSNKKEKIIGLAFCIIIPLTIMLAAFLVFGYAPFGINSLATNDANNQYLDFFSYLKDVLAGKNDISYSFGKTLGGDNFAVFSYYLSSPLNLLVIFFDQSELNTFFDILVVLKILLASCTSFIFLSYRFAEKN